MSRTKSKVTLSDVAAQAGVSRSAVSRTYTPGASVSKSTREKVKVAAAALGYRPNILARSLTTGQTRLVGLIANNFHNPLFLEVFDRFTRLLQEIGLRTLLINLTDETDPQRSLDLLMQYQVDAVVIASSTLPVSFAKAFADAGLPVVHTFGRPNECAYDVVGIDNVKAGHLAAQRLIACGYKSVGFLGGPERSTSTRDRLEGFLGELNGHSNIATQVSFADEYTFDGGYSVMTGLIESGLTQGYFCGDDVISIGAMSALQKAGFKIPQDVGLIGFNNSEIAAWENIRLTTVAQPLSEIIDETVRRIHAMLSDPDAHKVGVVLMSCEIIERDTLPNLANFYPGAL